MKPNWKENWVLYLIVLAILVVTGIEIATIDSTPAFTLSTPNAPDWQAPSLFLDIDLKGEEREAVIYGNDLIAHTSRYFGPGGQIASITNGMNCQNCHLDAGKREWGNNYSAVGSTYPKFRDRSGTIETIPKRVNDCFERSLNGQAIDTGSREMKAIVAYIRWLGKEVPTGEKPAGSGIVNLPYLNRAANPGNGALVYAAKCQSCHGPDGQGASEPNGYGYAYPPLWGEHSYNTGAGMYRLSRLSGYVRDNMPFNQASHGAPVLTDEEAWDVAAYVNSQPRPIKDLKADWPDPSKKPVDHPFGPYTDGFSETQHKYGPFEPIVAARKGQKGKTH